MCYLITFVSCLLCLPALAMDYPETRRESTVNSYHKLEVADPYQWLEDWSSAEVKAWSAGQNKVTRSELSPNGAFNIPEFGAVKNPDHFNALYAYSPYHNLKKASYPSILFMTGENAGRVDPMHPRKMTAALQFENTSINPILLRTSGNTGHGSGTPLNETITQQVEDTTATERIE